MATCIHSSRSCLLPFYTIPIFPLLNRKIFHLLVYCRSGNVFFGVKNILCELFSWHQIFVKLLVYEQLLTGEKLKLRLTKVCVAFTATTFTGRLGLCCCGKSSFV